MIIPQLWVGRMRRDAADALAYDCSGLMGIHWRTRVLGPNVSALSKAAWDQTGWNPDFGKNVSLPEGKLVDVHSGGSAVVYGNNIISETGDDAVYQSCLYGMNYYDIEVPDGVYDVILKFCEIHYKEPGKRIFGVKIQGKQVLEHLDVYAKVGDNKALDYRFKNIEVNNKKLKIEFTTEVEFPFIAGIEIKGGKKAFNQFAGGDYERKINCGGSAYKGYEKDLPVKGIASWLQGRPRDLSCEDFYLDWAKIQFGENVAHEMGMLFTELDAGKVKGGLDHSMKLPRVSTWADGPGGLVKQSQPWSEEKKRFAFVNKMESLRQSIKGAGNLERFDYWLNSFRYVRAIGEFNCTLDRFDKALEQVRKETRPAQQKTLAYELALPIRKELVAQLAKIYEYLLATVSTPGEMGTVCNWQSHVLPMYFERQGQELSNILGEPLPADALPSRDYQGKPRMFVPTVRTSLAKGEALELKVVFLGGKPSNAALYWRLLGPGTFTKIPLSHVNRGVYKVTIPANAITADFEYYIKAEMSHGNELFFPATAPALNQTLIISEY